MSVVAVCLWFVAACAAFQLVCVLADCADKATWFRALRGVAAVACLSACFFLLGYR